MSPLSRVFYFGAALAGITFATAAPAAVLVRFDQVGSDVIATASGSFDVSVARSDGVYGGFGGYIRPTAAFFGFGPQSTIQSFELTDARQTFGPATALEAYTSTSGTTIGMNGYTGSFFLGTNYVSGSAIATTTLFSGTTIAALGLTPAVYSFRAGGNAITVSIGQAATAVPEPATWALMLIGFAVSSIAIRKGRACSVRRFVQT